MWGGNGEACEHEWGDKIIAKAKDSNRGEMEWTTGGNPATKVKGKHPSQGQFCCRCGAWRGCLGLEPQPDLYVAHIVEVMQGVKRVLRDDGVLWLNLGDSYTSGGRGTNRHHREKMGIGTADAQALGRKIPPPGLKPKDLCCIPWRVAMALQADGWWLRSAIIWAKPNPMPESVTDRPTNAYEYVFLLTKAARYFYDAEAVREKPATSTMTRVRLAAGREGEVEAENKAPVTEPDGYKRCESARVSRDAFADPRDHLVCAPPSGGRNLRNVWTIPTQPFPGAHFAVFPEALAERCIKAGTSEKGCCPECGKAWERVIERVANPSKYANVGGEDLTGGAPNMGGNRQTSRGLHRNNGNANTNTPARTLGWRPGCGCGGPYMGRKHNEVAPIPCLCLDPFSGAGTVALVAARLGRQAIGIEAKAEYNAMAERRIGRALRPATFVDSESTVELPLFQETKGD